MERLTSGIGGLDSVLGGGLIAGDNVVWFGGADRLHGLIQSAFFTAAPPSTPKVFVSTKYSPADVARRAGADIEVLDARPGKPFTDAMHLERTVLERGRDGAWVVIDNLDDLVRRLGSERSLALFSRICPQLFDLGAICYWRASEGSRPIREAVRGITQCVLDVAGGKLRIEKAEGRHGVQGRIYRIDEVGGQVTIDNERAVGRLAAGLRQLRTNRQLSQSDIARVAGVSPSAISQAESGHRGLGLDTLVSIADGFGVGLDELLRTSSNAGYVLARRDRTPPRRGVTTLLDDPAAGLRAYLVHLAPGEQGVPPAVHKGPELVVIGSGLVQLDLGTETPVMRAGDAALATTVAVRGWRNLLAAPSRFFWVLRDPLPRD